MKKKQVVYVPLCKTSKHSENDIVQISPFSLEDQETALISQNLNY